MTSAFSMVNERGKVILRLAGKEFCRIAGEKSGKRQNDISAGTMTKKSHIGSLEIRRQEE